MRTGEGPMNVASEAEVRSALQELTVEHRQRLLLKAKWALAPYRKFAEGREPWDLVAEAVLRTLDRRRGWNRAEVDFLGHLFGVIDSLACHLAERYHKDPREVPLGESNELNAGDAEAARNSEPCGRPSPEAALEQNEDLERIEPILADDPDLLRLARSLGEHAGDLRCGPAVRQELGLTVQEYHTQCVRLRRTLLRKLNEV